MECEQIREVILTDYLDDELPAARKAEVTSHLAGCPQCRHYLTRVEEVTVTPLHLAAPADPPADLFARIQQAIAPEPRVDSTPAEASPSWFAALFTWCRHPAWAGVAVGILLLAGGFAVSRQHQAATQVVVTRAVPTFEVDLQSEFSFYSGDSAIESTLTENANFGTAMEQCFL